MPIYEYQCNACCHCFEELAASSNSPSPRCPHCDCADVQRLMSAGCVRSRRNATDSGSFKAPGCRPSG